MQKALPLLCALLLSGALSGPAARAADYTNSIGMQFNNIPAGRFYMGSCQLSEADKEADKKRKFMGLPAKGATCPSGAGAGVDDEAYDDETPQHEVHIRRGFRMGVMKSPWGSLSNTSPLRGAMTYSPIGLLQATATVIARRSPRYPGMTRRTLSAG